jgi:hypothetical protein
MTHHPHVHMIVPGGGLAKDGSRWVSCKPNFSLPVRVLSKLFRRLMLTKLAAAHVAGKAAFFGAHAHLTAAKAFAAFLAPLKKTRWLVCAKRPFAGPKTPGFTALGLLGYFVSRRKTATNALLSARAGHAIVT